MSTDPKDLVADALEREAWVFTRGFWSTAPWAGAIREHLHGQARNYRKGWRDPETGEMIDPEHSCSNCDAPWDPEEGPRCLNCGEEVPGAQA